MKELLSIEDPIAGLLGAWSAGLSADRGAGSLHRL